jgi:peroxiredoxin
MIIKKSIQWNLFSLAILLLCVGLIWFSRVPEGSNISAVIVAPKEGFMAPDFTLPTLEGESITLSDLNGSAILINIWASWCPPCRAEMPAMQSIYEKYHDDGFIILAVNATNQDSLPSVNQFIQSNQLTFPVLLDTDGKVSTSYQLLSLPTSLFVDKNGIVQEVVIGGPMSEALLLDQVKSLLEDK